MGALIRNKAWSDTPLGPIESWPQSLRSAVSILLPSKAQIVLFWGPELVAIYNDAYRPAFGSKHPAALGKPARECWSEVWDVLEPLFGSVVETGEAFWAKDHLFGLERHGYVEETYFDVSYDPIRDETGHVGGIFCIVSETTGRIIGERRLAVLRDLGRIAHGASSAGEVFRNAAAMLEQDRKDLPFLCLYGWDERERAARLEASAGLEAGAPGVTARIDAANRSAWPLGGDAEMVLVEPAVRLGSADAPWPEAPKQAAVIKIAARGRAPYGYLVAGISPRRPFDEDYADFLRLVGANIANAVASVNDLEEERGRARALAELDRAKTIFFSNVSHEFRTPLTLMLGPLEDFLARSEGSNAQDLELLHVAQRNGLRLQKLVNTLLDYARIEAGRAQASYQPTDLAALTADLASNFRSACERAGLRLNVDCQVLPEPAYVDREMWEKIVLNLLSNAFKFTLEGAISLQLRDVGARLEFTVHDTGVGIPPEALPQIFERFHRVEDSRGRSHEGSGIGLALVNELVKLHGGAISVQSTPGAGSTFVVTIPKGNAHLPAGHVKAPRDNDLSTAARADAYVAEALSWLPGHQSTSTVSRPEHTQRILLADDNADLRNYVQRLLGEHYEVESVADGQAALAAARARRPHLIISDVMMPRLDGFELICELRADPNLRAIPVILLSARAGEEARLEGLGKGADDYLVKPFSSRELLVRVATLLNLADVHRSAEEARAQFETLLNAAPLGVYLIDDAFRIAAVNPVALPVFGEIGDLIGRDFDEIIHLLWPKPYADEIVRLFRRTLETGEPHFVPEYIEERLDRGVTEYYEWQINRIPLPGNRHGVVCYFRDISKAVLAREALREADSRKDEFLATLSHELRNPLAPLRSSFELLKLGPKDYPAHATAPLEIMERQIGHLVRLVDDLMEVSRISRGKVELRKEPLRLDVALRNAMEATEPLIRAGSHRLQLSLPPETLIVEADPVRLAQIFGNILNNAAKYSDNGGLISIEARREGREAVVQISDTGEGIEPEQLRHLFKMFSRGKRTAQRNQTGLGIGLALVRQLTELHGGRVDAASEGPGKGSRFTVRLPLSAAQQRAAGPQAASPAIGPMKILLVDDNKDAAESLCMLLELLGADVMVAHGGAQALEMFQSARPLMVLLDIGMPDMDGYEVARRIRALAQQSQRPCATLVALTGWGQNEDRLRAREAGFDHHLVKPAEIEVLKALIESVKA
jgi:PAS domain S-box-containing protein